MARHRQADPLERALAWILLLPFRLVWWGLRRVWRSLNQSAAQLGPGERPTREAVELFYKSKKWRRLALKIKMKRGFRCECCGFAPPPYRPLPSWLRGKDQNYIVTDHIKSVKNHWDLRLDPRNLQVLCNDCNLAKGSNNSTNFKQFKTGLGWVDGLRRASAKRRSKIGSEV